MKLTLLTIAGNDYWPLLQITAPNKLEYCLRWGHQLVVNRHVDVSATSPERHEMLLDTLESCDWVLQMGADTLIMNQTVDVSQFLDNDYDLIMSEDYNGINNDVAFIRNTEASKLFFKDVISKLGKLPNDQEIMKSIFKENVFPNFKYKILPQKLFNAYLYDKHIAYVSYPKNLPGTFVRGDFVLHFPGMGLGARIHEAINYSKEVIR